MRTGKVTALALAAGMLSTLLIAAAPAEACSLVAEPTYCAVKVYENTRNSALAAASNAQRTATDTATAAQGQASAALGDAQAQFDAQRAAVEAKAELFRAWSDAMYAHSSGCGGVEVVQLPLPAGLPQWDPRPAIDGNVAYVGSLGEAGERASESAAAAPFVAAGTFVSDAWFSTTEAFQGWDANVFQPLLVGPVTSIEINEDIIVAPTIPTPDELGATAGNLGAEAQGRADCMGGAPLPPL